MADITLAPAIRPAAPEDLPRLLEIYAAARAYMAAHGNPGQWAGGYPEPELLMQDIRQGQLYVCQYGAQVHAAFVLAFGADPTYACIRQGRWPHEGPYATIHRLASDGSVHGVGRAVVDWCAGRAAVLRADTHENNRTMQQLLTRCGFSYCGIIQVADGTPRLAYQRG